MESSPEVLWGAGWRDQTTREEREADIARLKKSLKESKNPLVERMLDDLLIEQRQEEKALQEAWERTDKTVALLGQSMKKLGN